MSNCEVNQLAVLELEQHQVKEVLHCLLHTIVFSRALGPVRPQEVDLQLLDITYAKCGDAGADARIAQKVQNCCAWADKNPGKRTQVVLSFYEKRQKQQWGFTLGKQEERLFWEQWIIDLQVVESGLATEEHNSAALNSVRTQRRARLQSALEDRLTHIVALVNSKKEHIPPVVSQATVTYPFDITIAGEGGMPFGLDAMKRLLMQTAPPPVLS
mmetsp:Transcript_4206/g.12149  ORF Transcript_4206/g.12149 Transcript_4206/m.12149 type:complete len:214 (-) Transcript_4206:1524-2165(-)